MAVKASAHITLTSVVDIQATYRYYLLQSSTLAKPAKPTTNPPSSSWGDSEPTYTAGSTNSLYFVDLTVFSNGTFSYSEVSLSTAYEAAKEAYNKAQNAQNSANNAQADIDNLEIGGRNLLRYSDITKCVTELDDGTTSINWIPWNNSALEVENDYLKVTPAESVTSAGAYPPKVSELENNTEYTMSFDAYADAAIILDYCHIMCDDGNKPLYASIPISTTPGRYTYTFTTTAAYTACSVMLGYTESNGASTTFYIRNIKVEKGNRATDWTVAPEDLDETIGDISDAVDGNAKQISDAQLVIDSINASISSLVSGQNGESLMTQTDDGWTFNMSSYISALNTANDNIETLSGNMTDAQASINNLNTSVTDLGKYKAYITFSTDDTTPYILLGATTSDFKVKITNEAILFLQNEKEVAYISNQKLYIEDADVTNELRQGSFVWEVRSNGNYGLSWKG